MNKKRILALVLSLAMLFNICYFSAYAEETTEPDMTSAVVNVTASNAQDVLDGKYGDITGKTINFTEDIAEVLDLARTTKYAGSGTQYHAYNGDGTHAEEMVPITDDTEISAIKAGSKYYRTLTDVTFTADEGVTVAGFVFSAGHVYANEKTGPVYDYVKEVWTEVGSAYYDYRSLDGLTFRGLTVTGQVDAKLYIEGSTVKNIVFDGCTFTGTTDDGANAAIKFLADSQYFTDIKVENCNIDGYYQGIYIQGVDGAEVSNNNISNTEHNAIALQSHSNPAKGAIAVKENYISDVTNRAIRFGDVGNADIAINNNIMVDCGNSNGELIAAVSVDGSATVNLESNYWDGKDVSTAVSSFNVPTTVGITGGTWDIPVADYVADGYQLEEDGSVVETPAEKPVATVDGVKYTDLQAAINAAQSGDTVEIYAGEYDPINISNKNITIKGTVGDNGELLTTIKGGDPAITGHSFNGTIKDIKIIDAWKVMYAEPAGNVTVDNVYVTGATYGFHLVAYTTGITWTIQNSYMDLRWANSFGVYGGYADIIVKGNEFASTNPYYPDYGALAVNTFSPNVTVEENIFRKNARIYIDDSVTDTSNINVSKNYHADGVDKAFAVDEDGGKTVDIYQYYTEIDENGNLSGLVEIPATPAAPVAKIGENTYTSLADALAAAVNGDTIIVIDDIVLTETVTIAADDVITLDLNGKTVSMSDSSSKGVYAITNKGNLTIKDSSEEETGKITFVSSTPSSVNSYSTSTIGNAGHLVVESGTIENTTESGASYAIDTVWYTEDVSLTIAGGTIESKKVAIRQVLYSATAQNTLNISDGTIIGGTAAAQTHNFQSDACLADVNITGGTLKGTYAYYTSYSYNNTHSGTDIEITDGTFDGAVYIFNSQAGSDAAEFANISVAGGKFNGYVLIYTKDADGAEVAIPAISGGTFATDVTDYLADGYALTENADGTFGVAEYVPPVAKIGETEYATIADALAAATAGAEIVLLADVEGGINVPADVTFNGNGFAVKGTFYALGDITFAGHTKIAKFDFENVGTEINIGVGACLEVTGTGRMVIGHGCTFNIEGNITDAKTANVAELTPSLIMPGASFTGAGVTFNVKNAYIKTTAQYCSSSKSASGTFDFNIENSIWEQFGKLAFESQSTAATVNFDLKDSVLTTTSHLVFGVSRGEIVIDNSNVNVGTSRQIENQSTMIIKNGSVVNGAVATSSNAKNPGTIIVEDATYAVTGEFSGSDLGIGTIILNKDANFTAGSITKANITIDAAGLTAGQIDMITADLSKFAGEISVINNTLGAKIENGKIVLVVKPVAKIGETTYTSLQAALDAAAAGTGNVTVDIISDIDLTGVDWNPVVVSGPGYPMLTVNGNKHVITGLNDMLFASTWAGKSGLVINELTIKDSNIEHDVDDTKGNIGVGAFIGYPQASAVITLNDCHLVDSTVNGGHWTGGLIGMAGGYNGNDGPVFMNLTITNCSVTGSTVTGKGSAGGVIGHGSCAAWTNVVIENTTVSGNTITSTGSSTNKAGAVMGTIGAAGQETTANGETKTGGASVSAIVSDNTVTSNGTAITTIYGRQGTETGKLVVSGGTYEHYPIEKNVSYANPADGYVITENDDGTYGVEEAPSGTLSCAYTSATGYWGECGGNAKKSFEFKFYNDDTYMGYTNLNNVGGIIDGSVYVSWSIKLDAASNTDPYWTMAWEVAPTIAMQPNRVEQWVDGVKVAECAVQPNWSDSIFPVVAAVTDADGKILSYVNNRENATLANAFANGGNIVLLKDITGTLNIPADANVVLDLNGKTLTGSILAPNATLTISNGSIVNIDSSVSAIEINAGELTLTDVNIDSARHAVRIDGAVTATINGGTYRSAIGTGVGTYHAVNVSGAANVTVEDGTFIGPKGTTADSGAAVNAQAGATVTINDGTFTGGKANTLAAKGTLTVKGGIFDQDPNAYLADGYTAIKELTNGCYVVGETPTATVNNLGAMTIPAGDYYVYDGNLSTGNVDMPLNFVMQFVADQDAEDMETSPYADWYADFVITFEGIENGSFDSTGCYLAGYYGSTDSWDGMWVKIPVEGIISSIDEGTRYPVMMGVGMPQTYNYICSGVQAFSCAMFIPENILKDNPNLKVNLELNVVDSSDDSKALEALQTGNNIYKASETTYTAEDFAKPVAKIGETTYTTLQAAFDAAASTDTITLLSDVEVTEEIKVTNKNVLNGNVTLDGAGYKITAGALDKETTSILYFGKPDWLATGVTIKDLTIDAQSARFAIMFYGGTSSTLENVTITGDYLYAINLYGTHGATMKDCNIVSVFTNGQDDNPLTLINTDIDKLYANKSDVAEDKTKVFIDTDSTVNELTFWGTSTQMIESLDNVVIVKDSNGNSPVVAIGAVQYTTLQAAVDAAVNGDTIELLSDIEMTDSVVISDKTLTLDLGEHTIYDKNTDVLTSTDNKWGLIALKDNSNLTVCGNGTIDCNYNAVTATSWTGMAYCFDVDETSELTVNGGFFTNGNGGIQTAGKVTVNNGTFVSHNGGTCIMATGSSAYVTVNDGIFKDSVEDDDVYTGSGAVWSGFGATVKISGGSYDFAADPEHNNIVWTLFPAQNAISGYGENANMTVSGGTFVNFNPATDAVIDWSKSTGFEFGSVVAEGYEVTQNEDGSYGVVEETTTELFGFKEVSASLDSSLALNLYLNPSDLTGEGYYAVVEHTKATGNVVTTNIPYSEWVTTSKGKAISYTGIAAKEMVDKIKVTVYNADATQASEAYETSLKDYAMGMLDLCSKNSALSHWLPVFVDMLNYGAAAQTIFNYNTSNLANADAGDFQQHASTTYEISNEGCSAWGARTITLTLEDMIKLNVYFNNVEKGMKATYSYTTHGGTSVEGTVEYDSFVNGAVPVDLAIADAATLVTVTLFNSDGTEAGKVVYSVNAYLKGMIDLGKTDDIYPALAKFAASAKASFAK